MLAVRLAAVLVSLTAVAAVPASTSAVTDVPFTTIVIDADNPKDPHCKTVGDVDGDGFPDVVVASSDGEGMYWYEYPAWTKRAIRPTGSWSTDMQLADVDGDGDNDVIASDLSGIRWYENPRPLGDPRTATWRLFTITTEQTGAHDVEVGDLNGDGRIDVVTRPLFGGATHVWIQGGSGTWAHVRAQRKGDKGTSLGDLDGDGDLDIAHNGFWVQNLGGGTSWSTHAIATWPSQVGVLIADVDGDGRNDVVLAPSERSGTGPLVWYESATPRTGPWSPHIVDDAVSHFHSFKAGDVDLDGDLDLVTAESHEGSDPDDVSVYRNNGSGLSWSQQVIATTGSHNVRIADIGADGDLDVVGANAKESASDGAAVTLWRNDLLTDGTPVNGRPSVAITAPQSGASYTAPAAITIEATASDPDGLISTVEFFRGATLLDTDSSAPYSTTWRDVPPGSYSLTARAHDDAGGSATSAPVAVTVSDPSVVGGGGAGGVPSQGLGLWLRADAGLVHDASGVSAWADQSGNGRTATQSAVSARPGFIASAVGGRPAVAFDGTADHLTFAFRVNGLTGMTILLVSANTQASTGGNSGAERAAIFWNKSTSGGMVYLSPFQTNVKARFGTTQTSNRLSYTRPSSIGSAYSITAATKDTATEWVHVNGVLVASEGEKLATLAGNRDTGNLGRGLDDNTFFPGQIAEVLVYTRALSDDERKGVEQYLRQRYGL